MAAIIPVPTQRTSDVLLWSRMLAQLQRDQLHLLSTQNQLATGRRILAPSEDAPAALRAIGLQRLLERKEQAQVNLTTSRSYLSATDAALSEVADLLANIRGTAVSVVGSTASDVERQAASQEVQGTIQQLTDIGNQKFRGRYLFAGSKTTTEPFEIDGQYIRFDGNNTKLQSYADTDLLFETNVAADDVFGTISGQMVGTADLNPILTPQTRLADLNAGNGIGAGSIAVSDGNSISTLDVSSAETIGDVIRLIELNPPTGRTVSVRLSDNALVVDIDDAGGGNLTIREVGGDTVAGELGILEVDGTGTAPIVGEDLDPRLSLTTSLSDILGVRAVGIAESTGSNNDLSFQAVARGAQANGITVQFVNDSLLQAAPGLAAGNETVSYDANAVAARASLALPGADNDLILTANAPGTGMNNVAVSVASTPGLGNVANVSFGDVGGVPTLSVEIENGQTQLQTLFTAINGQGLFTASADSSDGEGYNGTATIDVGTQGATGNTGNSGGAPRTVFVHVEDGGTTANHVIAAVAGDPTVSALVSAKLDGYDTTDPGVAGQGKISINATATLSGGSGIQFDQDSGLRVVNGGQTHVISFQNAQTIEDLLNTLNGSNAHLLAEINTAGNGINVRSRLSGSDFHIGENGGWTATHLGIRSFTQGTLLVDLNHGFGVGTADGTDLTIVRSDSVELDIDISSAVSVGDVIDLINNNSNNGDNLVVAQLTDTGNGIELVDSGGSMTLRKAAISDAAWNLGLLPTGQSEITEGSGVLVGTDVGPLETKGIFNSLIRLNSALGQNNIAQIQRAIEMLDNDLNRLTFSRGELGAWEQGLDVLERRLEDEDVQLKEVLSLEIDVELTEAITRLIAQQTAYQISLKTVANTYQLTLLNFL